MWRWGAAAVAGMVLGAPHLSRVGISPYERTSRQALTPDTGLRALDTKGYAAMIAAHRGHVVIVDFWATWCSPCREEMPGVIALTGRYSEKDVQMVTVSADMAAQTHDAEQFLDSVRAPSARYIKQTDDDDRFIQSVDSAWTGALPAIFVYDRQGHKVRAFFGETLVDSVAVAVRAALGA